METSRREPSHYMEGSKSRPLGRPRFFALHRWPQHPPPRGRRFFACYVMAGLTPRLPEIMKERRRLWFLFDYNDIHRKPTYIISAANTWGEQA
jgi:hypothetical protein